MTATCLVKRIGKKEQMATFSLEDARTAKLLGKDNWIKYPKRMLQMRARAFALRDVFPDVLQGLGCTEEVQDYPDSAKTKAVSKSESNVVSFPTSAMPTIEVLPQKQQAVEVRHETPQTKSVQVSMTHPKESSPELKQFVDNLAQFNKGVAVQSPAQPKTTFHLMRERLNEQQQYQKVKGIDAVERLKTMMPALQNGKGV
jgi:hypothetical protein